MYINLRMLMFKNKISIKEMSQYLGLTRNTLTRKIKGQSPFTLNEIIVIRAKYFQNVTLEFLCEKG